MSVMASDVAWTRPSSRRRPGWFVVSVERLLVGMPRSDRASRLFHIASLMSRQPREGYWCHLRDLGALSKVIPAPRHPDVMNRDPRGNLPRESSPSTAQLHPLA